jgi:hypothetical protein
VKLVYLVNPKPHIDGYFGSDVYAHWGLSPVQSMADLTIVLFGIDPNCPES